MKYLILLLLPAIAFAQPAETMHGQDYLDLVLYILAGFGSGGLFSAFLPVKARTAVPLVNTILSFVGANFLNAKNKDA